MSDMDKQISKLEEIICGLLGAEYIEDMPLMDIDDEYHLMEFETDIENVNYLIELLEEIVYELNKPEDEEE